MKNLEYKIVVDRMRNYVLGHKKIDMFEASTILAILFNLSKVKTLSDLIGYKKTT